MEKRSKILIVEDEEVTALTIQKMLEPDYEVIETVSTGEGAVKEAEKYKPDLVLMDIVLKDQVDGIQAAEKISQLDIPVVYMTAYSDEETLSRAKITNPHGYLVKPINNRELCVTVEVSLHNHEMEKRLRESEERYRSLADLLPVGVFEADLDGWITFINRKALDYSGYAQQDFESGLHITQLFVSEDVGRVEENFQKVLGGEGTCNEYTALRRDGTTYAVEVTSNPILRGDEVVGVRGVAIDITKRKQEEEALKRKLMRFNLNEGKVYLSIEESPLTALSALKDLQKVGYKGIVVSRSPVEELDIVLEEGSNYLWLSEADNSKSISPDLDSIEEKVEEISDKNFVYLDSLDYLVFKNGYKKILGFVQRLREVAYLKQLIIILSMGPQALSEEYSSALYREVAEIEPAYPEVSENALNVLDFVYRQNAAGVKPSYTDISQRLGLTRQSVSKLVRHLESKGYVREEKGGRSKLAEITDKGRHFFELSD